MRARYYSPELRRFINADIIAGEISNAITLNRYAYANGNPVSNVDPFGLESFFGNIWSNIQNGVNAAKDWAVTQYNKTKNWIIEQFNTIKDWLIDQYNGVKNWAQETFKEIENTLLQKESIINDKIFESVLNRIENCDDPTVLLDYYLYFSRMESALKNYEHNREIDITDNYVYNQNNEKVALFVLGNQSMKDNGCEAIAVYNAMLLLDRTSSLAAVACVIEASGSITGGNLIDGYFGSNPYSLPKVFDALNLRYEEVSLSDLNTNGVYVISFWNSKDFDSMIHTVAVQKNDEGFTWYNASKNIQDLSQFNMEYIIGYRVYAAGRK